MNIREFFCGGHEQEKTCNLHHWDDVSIILGIVFIGLLTFDVLTTIWAVSLGGFERNTLIAPIVTNHPFFIVVKTGEAIFFILLAQLLNSYIRGAAIWCYGAANIIALASVINNVIVLGNLL